MNNELDFGKALSSPGPKFTSRFGFCNGTVFYSSFYKTSVELYFC